MRFVFDHLGPLSHADIELNKLTIVCGHNNTGKTYLTYALYAFLHTWEHFLEVRINANDHATLRETGSVSIDLDKLYLKRSADLIKEATKQYKKRLSDFLAAQEGRFDDTEVECELAIPDDVFGAEFEKEFKSEKGNRIVSFKKKNNSSILEVSSVITDDLKSDSLPRGLIESVIKQLVWGRFLPTPFIVSTERTGAVTFRSELNLAKNRLIDLAHRMKAGDEYSPMGLIKSVFDTGYPLPVDSNIDFINGLSRTEKRRGQIATNHPNLLNDLDGIIGGSYKITKEGDVNFIQKATKQKLKMGESSSAVRSLVVLSYYLKHLAKTGDLLIIDEPELNLHPCNQRKLARLIARLVNVGVKVFITTHSDYFIKEFNTLIMLKQDKKGVEELRKSSGYDEGEALNSSDVSLYTINANQLYKPKHYQRKIRGTVAEKADIDPVYGIQAPSFDQTINEMNALQDELYSILEG